MRSGTSRICLAALVVSGLFAGVVGGAAVAHASSPNEIYVVASKVEQLPDAKNATSVIIHGAFFFYTNNGQYSAPKCGVMYFSCPPGSEVLCRQQWTDVARIGALPGCAGFGQESVMTKATFYNEGDPLGRADLWNLGLGVGQGAWVGGQCQPALMLKCGGAAPPDMAMTSANDLAISSPPDLSTAPPADMAQVKPADLSTPQAAPDLAKAPSVAPPSCAVGGGGGARPGMLLPLGLLVGLALRRRRRG